MKIAISAESTIDLSKELLEKYNIHTVPFTVLLGDEVCLDGEIDSKKIFEYVERTKVLPKTSAVNGEQFKEHFTKLLKDYDAIIHFSLSSELSCAYENAKAVAQEMNNVYVIDTKSLSTGIALQAIYAQKLIKLGVKLEDVVKRVEQKVPYTQASFVIKNLKYLYKGGRCSALSLFGANILGIKPQIILRDGKMGPYHKYRGQMEKVIKDYCEDTLKEFNNPDLDVAFVTYSSATDEMINVADECLKKAGFKTIYHTSAGATVSSHCGENTLGILYLNNKD